MRRPRLALTLLCLVPGLAFAQDEADEATGDRLPTLDELLGTGGPDSGDGGARSDLPEDTNDDELDRLLSGREIADQFREAVELMGRSATRLGASRDTGARTQRMQEDVLRKLDRLIADAEKRSQQASSSPSPSSGQQRPREQPRQQGAQEASDGDNRGEVDPPGLRTGPLRPEAAADLAAWGSLPARVRDALVQGSTDRFSATYRKLTEAYYRMLAEEAK